MEELRSKLQKDLGHEQWDIADIAFGKGFQGFIGCLLLKQRGKLASLKWGKGIHQAHKEEVDKLILELAEYSLACSLLANRHSSTC